MVDFDYNRLSSVINPKIAQGIIRVRENKVKAIPGYDGVYGIIKVFEEDKKHATRESKSTLF